MTELVIYSTADRRIKKYSIFQDPFWAIVYDCTSAKQTDRFVGMYVDNADHKVTHRVAHDFDLSNIPTNTTITKIELEVQILTAAEFGATDFYLRSRTRNIGTACNVTFWNACANGTIYDTVRSWNSIGWKGPYDLGTTAVADLQTDLGEGSPFEIALQTKLETLEDYAGLLQQTTGARITVNYFQTEIKNATIKNATIRV